MFFFNFFGKRLKLSKVKFDFFIIYGFGDKGLN